MSATKVVHLRLGRTRRNRGGGLPPARASKDWVPNRLGANPPELFSSTQGTAAREAFRRFLNATVTPVLAFMAAEAALKLDTPGLAFDTTGMHAADVAVMLRSYD